MFSRRKTRSSRQIIDFPIGKPLCPVGKLSFLIGKRVFWLGDFVFWSGNKFFRPKKMVSLWKTMFSDGTYWRTWFSYQKTMFSDGIVSFQLENMVASCWASWTGVPDLRGMTEGLRSRRDTTQGRGRCDPNYTPRARKVGGFSTSGSVKVFWKVPVHGGSSFGFHFVFSRVC